MTGFNAAMYKFIRDKKGDISFSGGIVHVKFPDGSHFAFTRPMRIS